MGIKTSQWALRRVNGHKDTPVGIKKRQYAQRLVTGVKTRQWVKMCTTRRKETPVGTKTRQYALKRDTGHKDMSMDTRTFH